MLFDHHRPHAIRARTIAPGEAANAAEAARRAVERRVEAAPGLVAYAVHLSHDRTRIVTVEVWRDAATYRQTIGESVSESTLYEWAATGGVDPTPVTDEAAGVVIIDLFRVWRPLLLPVSAFNIRNGAAFNREPGCISTTVLRGIGTGAIATYARWESAAAFAAAFARITGRPAATPDEVNRAARSMTLGLIRPDYRSYALVTAKGALS